MVKEPEAPGAASYVIEPLKRQAPDLLEKIGRYCFDLAEYKRHQSWEEVEEEVDEELQEKLMEEEAPVKQEEMISCGKNCNGCPHGPYIYEYEWTGEKVESRYIGKA